jgi:hypothetical protein
VVTVLKSAGAELAYALLLFVGALLTALLVAVLT